MNVAFVTLVTNEDYALGALALVRSLRLTNPDFPLIVMATQDLPQLQELASEGCEIRFVDRLPLSAEFEDRHSRGKLHGRAPYTKGTKPIFHDPLDNFCKLRLWEYEEFERIVFLDADTIVVKNIEKLFGYPEFSAAPNLYETLNDMHRLNSGVFVAEPSKRTFQDMLCTLDIPDKFWKRTDQTFLESYFPDWHGLPYVFNALQYIYFHLPQLWRWESIRVVHYQYEKPWETNHVRREQLKPLIDLWYSVLENRTIPADVPPLNSGNS